MKVQKIESRNMWDGFDDSEFAYDEKAEKRYDGAIWKYLLGVAVVLFAITLWSHVQETYVVKNGIAIECAYYVDNNGAELARYYDESNQLHMFDVSNMNAVHTDDSITMYYADNIDNAVSKANTIIWVAYYLFFGTLGTICIWRIKKNKY